MDWFSWLSRTGLEPSLVYQYGLAMSQNELEEEDIAYFNHEFLQSMDISIAKHRLEILKLARRQSRGSPRPMSRLLLALKRTRRSLARYIHTWTRREQSSSALAVVPPPRHGGYSSRCSRGGAVVKRNGKKLMMVKQGRLLLTDSAPMDKPVVYDLRKEEEVKVSKGGAEGYMIRWDTMFQDLKPT